jgi:DNA-binding response OmpR family regulator
MNILLVEDSEYVADGIIRALRRNNHSVTWVKNVSRARDMITEKEFDLAILDYDLGFGGRGPDLIPDLKEAGVEAVLHSGIYRDDVTEIPQVVKGYRLEILDFVEEFATGRS